MVHTYWNRRVPEEVQQPPPVHFFPNQTCTGSHALHSVSPWCTQVCLSLSPSRHVHKFWGAVALLI